MSVGILYVASSAFKRSLRGWECTQTRGYETAGRELEKDERGPGIHLLVFAEAGFVPHPVFGFQF